MEHQKAEGITLHSFPYREKSRILKVYTKELGLVSFFITNMKKNFLTLCYPFCIAEIIFHKKKEDLYFLNEACILDTQSSLRNSYSSLVSASKISHALLRTQLSEEKNQLLYQLLKSFLQKIPSFSNPTTLHLAFYLKLLNYEGLLNIRPTCCYCKMDSVYLCGGNSVCEKHQTTPFYEFETTEWQTLKELLKAKKFTSLQKIHISEKLCEKIEITFKSLI